MRQAILAATALGVLGAATAGLAQVKVDPALVREVAAMREIYAKMPDEPGTGPYPAIKAIDPTLRDHVVYRPADLTPFGPGRKKLGILIWGNGACSTDGASARLHLEETSVVGENRDGEVPPQAIPASGFVPLSIVHPTTLKAEVV